jgi:hypothetical protein
MENDLPNVLHFIRERIETEDKIA